MLYFPFSETTPAYPTDVIAQCVRWYLAYALSLRTLEEMMAERGILVDHSTLHRWVIDDAVLPEAGACHTVRPCQGLRCASLVETDPGSALPPADAPQSALCRQFQGKNASMRALNSSYLGGERSAGTACRPHRSSLRLRLHQ
ncbi:hypothetical protein BSR02_16965 [Serratia liquefaciens]|nr:hypothetical protein BSR02_16965 [Serratia liquefaciens]